MLIAFFLIKIGVQKSVLRKTFKMAHIREHIYSLFVCLFVRACERAFVPIYVLYTTSKYAYLIILVGKEVNHTRNFSSYLKHYEVLQND